MRRTRFTHWLWSPVLIPRSALVAKYLLFVYFGAVSAWVGVPVFSLSAPAGYAVLWGALMVVAGMTGAIGAVRDGWQALEKWSVLVLFGLSAAYAGSLTVIAYVSHDEDRQALAAGITLILVLPLSRFLYLAKHGKAA